jgi:DNA helicase-2/ATP-dependent DNA helicase PcrA
MLNFQQQIAVMSDAKKVLVAAGPGTGKTKTLVHRFAHLLSQGADPRRIMLLTFTREAAHEMVERSKALLGRDIDVPFAGTFHSVFLKLLRCYSKYLPVDVRYADIIDDNTQRTVISELIRYTGLDIKPKKVQQLIGVSVNKMLEMDSVLKRLYSEYVEYKRGHSLIDFDDMLVLMYQLMQKVPEKIDSMFDHILVDEFQDTSRLQNAVLSMFKSPGLFCVGDDAQSIYSFRGADASVFREFAKDAKTVMLTYNYRSTAEIVELANRVIPSKAMKKILVPASGQSGQQPTVYIASLPDQIRLLPDVVDELLLEFEPHEIAVLARRNRLVKATHMALSERGIPSSPVGIKRFTERPHIKDMIAFVSLIANPHDANAWARFASTGKAKKIAETLTADDSRLRNLIDIMKSAKARSLSDNLEMFMKAYFFNGKDIGDDAVEDCRVLVELAKNKTPEEFLREMKSLGSSNGVQIMTIHKAKGLEWPAVVVLGIAEKVLPAGEQDNEELFYVAVTRAKQRLVILADKWMNPFVIKMLGKAKIKNLDKPFVVAS